MTWVKLDDQFFEHRKVRGLSKDAQLLFLASLAYSASRLTDGTLDAKAVRVLMATVDADQTAVQELSKAGMWDASNGAADYVIHDYLDYNPPAAKVIAEKQAAKERMRQIRERSGEQAGERSGEVRPSPSPSPYPVLDIPDPTTAALAALTTAYTDRWPMRVNATIRADLEEIAAYLPEDFEPVIAHAFEETDRKGADWPYCKSIFERMRKDNWRILKPKRSAAGANNLVLGDDLMERRRQMHEAKAGAKT